MSSPTPTLTSTNTPTLTISADLTNCGGISWFPYLNNSFYKVATVQSTPPISSINWKTGDTNPYYCWYGTRFFSNNYTTEGLGTVVATSNSFQIWSSWGEPNEGPLNTVGLKTTIPESETFGYWFGTSINITGTTSGKTYYVGIAADNEFKFILDGTILVGTYYRSVMPATDKFRWWNVYPITVGEGNHILEFYGGFDGAGSNFGAEVYDNTLSELLSFTSRTQINIFYSTLSIRNSTDKKIKLVRQDPTFSYTSNGFSCPSGFTYSSYDNFCYKYFYCILPTPTPTPSITSTPKTTSTVTPTRTVSPTKTSTSTITPTNTQTVGLIPTQTATNTQTPTNTNTVTITSSVTNSPTITSTKTPTQTSTLTNTITQTPTPSITASFTPSPTVTITPTNTTSADLSDCGGVLWSPYTFGVFYKEVVRNSLSPTTTSPTWITGQQFSVYSSYGARFYDNGYSVQGTGSTFYSATTFNLWSSSNISGLGPLNRNSVWTSPSVGFDTWVGFSICLSGNTSGKTYYVGIAADGDYKMVLDGTVLVNTYGNSSFVSRYLYWNVYPVVVGNDNHTLEVYGLNDKAAAAFGVEIYDNSLSQLTASTIISQLNVVFSSSSYKTGSTSVNVIQDSNNNYLSSGYTCPTSYIYSSCDNTCRKYFYCYFPTPTPTQTKTQTPTRTSTPSFTPTRTTTQTTTSTMTQTPTNTITPTNQSGVFFRFIDPFTLFEVVRYVIPEKDLYNDKFQYKFFYYDNTTILYELDGTWVWYGQFGNIIDQINAIYSSSEISPISELSGINTGWQLGTMLGSFLINPTPTPTQTPSNTRTPGPTRTATRTPSKTPTQTVTEGLTPTATQTPTKTPTPTNTSTRTQTPSNTPTRTSTQTTTQTNTPTRTSTQTITPTRTQTQTVTPTVTRTNTPTFTRTPDPTPVNYFRSKWRTFLANDSISLPLVSNGTYNFFVNWGDGTSSLITSYNQSDVTHYYVNPGDYTVVITGTIIGWSFNVKSSSVTKLLEIDAWGPLVLRETSPSGRQFAFCSNLILNDLLDTLNLGDTLNVSEMFRGCQKITTISNIGSWDVSKTTNMRAMFSGCLLFNDNINSWNVSGVTNMSFMFSSCEVFNYPLNNWNVSKVTDMSGMFFAAFNFNQPLSGWNVSSVTNMTQMFCGADSFNQNINNWNVSKVTNMSIMFNTAKSFNQPLSGWNVSNVTDISNMFNGSSFNQPINNWNVSAVTNMSYLFSSCPFNQPLNNWNLSKVTDLSYLFYYNTSFNQSINNWNVSGVTNMNSTFGYASSFSQPINSWNISNVANFNDFMVGKNSLNYSNSTYSSLLNSWGSLPVLKSGITITFGITGSPYSITYDSTAINGRNRLVNSFGWTIIDGGFFQPTSTPSPTITSTITPSVTPTLTPSITSSNNPTPTVTRTPNKTPSKTPSPTPPLPTPTSTVTATVTQGLTPTSTQTPTVTPTRLPVNSFYLKYLYDGYNGEIMCNGAFNFFTNIYSTLNDIIFNQVYYSNRQLTQPAQAGWYTVDTIGAVYTYFHINNFGRIDLGYQCPTPTQTPSNTQTPTQTVTPSVTQGLTPTATQTPTITPFPTETPTPTQTQTQAPTTIKTIQICSVYADGFQPPTIDNPQPFYYISDQIFNIDFGVESTNLIDGNTYFGRLILTGLTCISFSYGCDIVDLAPIDGYICYTVIGNSYDYTESTGYRPLQNYGDPNISPCKQCVFNSTPPPTPTPTQTPSPRSKNVYICDLGENFDIDFGIYYPNLVDGTTYYGQISIGYLSWDRESCFTVNRNSEDNFVGNGSVNPNFSYANCSDCRLLPKDENLFMGLFSVTREQPTVILPLGGTSSRYDGIVNWGDGSSNVLRGSREQFTHFYGDNTGDFLITISGLCEGFNYSNNAFTTEINPSQLKKIYNFGNLELGNNGGYFFKCNNLDLSLVMDTPLLSNMTNFDGMFLDCSNLTTIRNSNNWDVSTALNTKRMFKNCINFNSNISSWNTSNVIDMSSMFYSATSFNQNINSWNVSKVVNMDSMFYNTVSFNQPLSGWNITAVTKFDNFMGGESGVKSYNPDYLGQIYAQWSTLNVRESNKIDFERIQYNPQIGFTGRTYLIDNKGWIINDNGPIS